MNEEFISPAQRARKKVWQRDAECLSEDVEVFTVETRDAQRIAVARRICAKCPVILECLADAVKNGESAGVWGGVYSGDLNRFRRVVDDPYYTKEKHLKAVGLESQ